MNFGSRALLFATLIATFSTSWAQSEFHLDKYQPQVGRQHDDFTLPTIEDGNPVSLSDYRGKKVVLLHFASW
jgi:peroxiredoxin